MKYLITLLLFVFSASALPNPVPGFPFIILTERLEKRVEPDVVRIGLSLTSYASSSKESLDSLRVSGKSLLSLLKKHEISTSLLESTQIDKRTKRASNGGAYNLDILGYETTQEFNLKLSNLKKYPLFMNDLIAIDGVTGIQAFFESTKEEKYKAEMIQELSKKARKKANTLAIAQSRSVKNVYGITTESNFEEAYAIFKFQHNPSNHASVAMLSGSNGRDLTMMVPAHIVLNQRITVIYELK